MKLYTRFFLEGEGGEGGSNGGGSTLLGKGAGSGDGGGQQQQQDVAGITPIAKVGDEAFTPKAGVPDFILPKFHGAADPIRAQAEAYREAERLIGQKTALKAPAPDAPAEEVAKFNEQIRGVLGIPASPDEYKITKPETIPEGLKWEEGDAKEFAKLAHSLNIPPAAAQKLVEFDMQRMAKYGEQGKAKLDEFVKTQEAELRQKWGGEYDVNLSKASQFAKLAGFDLDDPQLGNNAKFIEAMKFASSLIRPDALVGSDKASTVMDGKAQAEDIRRNTSNPWHAAYMGKEGPSRQQEAAALIARLQGVKPE